MEQDTGVEPAFTAWEAVVLPIYESCKCGYYNKGKWKIQPLFVGDNVTGKSIGLWYTEFRKLEKEENPMKEYELVHEIKNLCRNNQMRDVFFEEVICSDPVDYLRQRLRGKTLELTVEEGAAGAVTIHAVVDGMMEKYVFTPI